jgi:hypothetical protein
MSVVVRSGGVGDCCGISGADDRPDGVGVVVVVRVTVGHKIRVLSSNGVFCSGACCSSRLVRCGVDIRGGFCGCCRSGGGLRGESRLRLRKDRCERLLPLLL